MGVNNIYNFILWLVLFNLIYNTDINNNEIITMISNFITTSINLLVYNFNNTKLYFFITNIYNYIYTKFITTIKSYFTKLLFKSIIVFDKNNHTKQLKTKEDINHFLNNILKNNTE